MRAWAWLCGIVVLLGACRRSPYPGFSTVRDGVDVKLHALGDGERAPGADDRVKARVRIAAWGHPPGSLFSTERWYALGPEVPFMQETFGRMHCGDSMSVIARARSVPWTSIAPELSAIPPDTQRVRLELALIAIAGADAALPMKQLPGDPEKERELLAAFADSTGWTSWGGVLFHQIEPGGDTTTIRTGDLVTIHYVGRFLDGTVFDDTRRSGPLTFRLGDPGQVIEGLEVAMHLLHPHGRGTFIIASELAFGAAGSSSGIVPPYTPVAYHVVVEEVRREGSLP